MVNLSTSDISNWRQIEKLAVTPGLCESIMASGAGVTAHFMLKIKFGSLGRTLGLEGWLERSVQSTGWGM